MKRCEPIFDRVLVWLKAHGVSARKPLHAPRKEYGPLINEKYDLVTAKELLRHSSVAITAAHYVENRKRGATGLGALLRTKWKQRGAIVPNRFRKPRSGAQGKPAKATAVSGGSRPRQRRARVPLAKK